MPNTDAVAPPAAGSEELFCSVWPEARSDLLQAWNGDNEGQDWGEALEIRVARYDRIVPSELRSEWDRAHTVFNDVMDLLFTVGYANDAVRNEHIEMMFGAEGPSPAVASAEEAIDSIDLWAATTCGDFCARWPELEEPFNLDFNNPNLGAVEDLLRNKERWEQLITVGDILIPQEIEAAWKTATAVQAGYVSMMTNAAESMRSGDESALPDSAFAEHMGMSADEAGESMGRALETIHEWRLTHCEDVVAAQTGSGPGRLFVHMAPDPEIAYSVLVMAVLPSGSHFGSVTSITDVLAGSCPEGGDGPPEGRDQVMQPVKDDTEYRDEVCQFRWEEEAILEPGSYELFVGQYRGDPGNWKFFVSAPESCAHVPVTVGGDTTIELPALGPCTVNPVGNPQETARRTTILGSADSSLQVRFEEAATPDKYAGCSVRLALLPAGTTLNDVGRGDVWPVGGTSLGLEPSNEGSDRPILVPILPFLASGGLQNINSRHDTLNGKFPDPASLPKGVYDLRIERTCYPHGDDDSDAIRSCAVTEVDVRGETVVNLPELGECP